MHERFVCSIHFLCAFAAACSRFLFHCFSRRKEKRARERERSNVFWPKITDLSFVTVRALFSRYGTFAFCHVYFINAGHSQEKSSASIHSTRFNDTTHTYKGREREICDTGSKCVQNAAIYFNGTVCKRLLLGNQTI